MFHNGSVTNAITFGYIAVKNLVGLIASTQHQTAPLHDYAPACPASYAPSSLRGTPMILDHLAYITDPILFG